MKIVIVTGLSGAGKTQALKTFEDMNYFCIDNMLPDLIPNFLEYASQQKANITNVALCVDVRSGDSFQHLTSIISKTENSEVKYEILFLECKDEELLKRYKEIRRQHPLSMQGRILDGIQLEREKVSELKSKADYIIDTTGSSAKKLKEKITGIFKNEGENNLFVNVVSFGFKYGVPIDVDFVFDVRFLDNPFYIDELKSKNGKDKEVFDYVMSRKGAKEFVDKVVSLFLDIIPSFEKEGRNQIVIGIGCTGGQHRSVTIAREIARLLQESKFNVILEHRELE